MAFEHPCGNVYDTFEKVEMELRTVVRMESVLYG